LPEVFYKESERIPQNRDFLQSFPKRSSTFPKSARAPKQVPVGEEQRRRRRRRRDFWVRATSPAERRYTLVVGVGVMTSFFVRDIFEEEESLLRHAEKVYY